MKVVPEKVTLNIISVFSISPEHMLWLHYP
jgi:hypothetical protein